MTPRSGRSSRASGCLRHRTRIHQKPVQRLTARCWAGGSPQLFFCQDKTRRSSRRNLLPTETCVDGSSLDWVIRSSTGGDTKAQQVLSKLMTCEATKYPGPSRHSLPLPHPPQSWRAGPLPPQAASVWHADILDAHRDCDASVPPTAELSQHLRQSPSYSSF